MIKILIKTVKSLKKKFTNPTTGEFDDKLFDNVYASAEAQYQKIRYFTRC